MGDLPTSVIMQSRSFNIVSLDFAGPFHTKCAYKTLGSFTKFNSYNSLFIGTEIKAVHLKLVSIISAVSLLYYVDLCLEKGVQVNHL